jgi:hypothetical protein
VIVAPSLHNVGGRSPIVLKIESQIPPKVRGPQNNKTSTRLSDGSFGRRGPALLDSRELQEELARWSAIPLCISKRGGKHRKSSNLSPALMRILKHGWGIKGPFSIRR